MSIFKNPGWLDKELLQTNQLEDLSDIKMEGIRDALHQVQSDIPLVSVIIPAFNEELNLVRCLDSLSKTVTDIPFEILVVNNNSTDRTQEIIDRLGVRSVLQPIQGWGPARQKGLEHARGKYILTADADCIYPVQWIDIMIKNLVKRGVVCVYGRYSYIAVDKTPRYQLWIYERFTDIMREIRHFKRPHLNCYGMSMGYLRDLAMKAKYVDKKIIGEDGRMCFDLMSYGKIKMVRAGASRVYTPPRSVFRNNKSLFQAIINRVIWEIARFEDYFKRSEPHDTKTSLNGSQNLEDNIRTIKKKLVAGKKENRSSRSLKKEE